jgi:hypothetical protein
MRNTLCTIDYLVGTMATAYKGLVTSLVARNCCMLEEDDTVFISAVVITLPAGDYSASLIQSGVEIARAGIKEGYFELKAEARRVMEAPDLQIDILQNGRHIGTFLLKRAAGGGLYTPAVELSQELKGFDFTLLAGRLRGRPGLFKKAEELIAGLFSVKRDWEKLSALMRTFSNDLFWEERESFYEWFPALARFSLRACKNMDPKALDGYISLIRLPLEEEKDEGRLGQAVQQWLSALEGSGADFSLAARAFVKMLSRIVQRFPESARSPALIKALESLRGRLQKAPLVSRESVRELRAFLPEDDISSLLAVSEESRGAAIAKLDTALRALRSGDYGRVPAALEEVDTGFFDETETLNRFFSIAERGLSGGAIAPLAPASARAFFQAARRLMEEMFSGGGKILSSDSIRIAVDGTVRIIRKIISMGATDVGVEALSLAGKEVFLPEEKILLNPEVASAVLSSGDENLVKTYKASLGRVLIPPARAGLLQRDLGRGGGPQASGAPGRVHARVRGSIGAERPRGIE